MKNLAKTVMAVLMCAFVTAAAADETKVGVKDAWINEAPPGAAAMAGYMTLHNPSTQARALVGARSAGFAMVMMHRTEMEGGMAKMVHQEEVDIPAGGEVSFAPGGYHLMLMRPRQAYKAGDKVEITLLFKNGTEMPVQFEVRRGAPMDMGGHGHMH
jgi:hypothetical protein